MCDCVQACCLVNGEFEPKPEQPACSVFGCDCLSKDTLFNPDGLQVANYWDRKYCERPKQLTPSSGRKPRIRGLRFFFKGKYLAGDEGNGRDIVCYEYRKKIQ